MIRSKLINQQHNGQLVDHFGVDKTEELIGRKCYWPTFRKDIKAYINGYIMCLALKAIKYKLYENL